MIGAWTSFLTTSMIFLLIGFLIFWDGTPSSFPWWCIFVPAITFIEAIRSTLGYFAREETRVCPNCHKHTVINNQFCDKCGHDLRAVTYQMYGKVEDEEPAPEVNVSEPPKPTQGSKPYCVTCGGPLEGSEAYCPTCGMPLKK